MELKINYYFFLYSPFYDKRERERERERDLIKLIRKENDQTDD